MAGQAKYKSMANIQKKEWVNQGNGLQEYLEQIAAWGNAGNKKLQQMAETMANMVAVTSKFQKQMEARDKQEAVKDA